MEKMKMKMAVVASLLLVSVQTTSAQYYYNYGRPVENFYYQYTGMTAAENDLATAKARLDKARKERKRTGKSDLGARRRFEAQCYRALVRGVADSVRRSYGCESSYVRSVQQPAAPAVVYPNQPTVTGTSAVASRSGCKPQTYKVPSGSGGQRTVKIVNC